MAGVALLAASVPMPAHSLSRDITYGAELLAGIPVALYPVWLIVLSYRLPGHLTASAPRGDRPQEDPGAGLPPRLADAWS